VHPQHGSQFLVQGRLRPQPAAIPQGNSEAPDLVRSAVDIEIPQVAPIDLRLPGGVSNRRTAAALAAVRCGCSQSFRIV
jgi:hypothetical protein